MLDAAAVLESAAASTGVQKQPLTQEDIDRLAPVPPKLGKDASTEEKTAREALMKLRRKMQEQLRQQSREPQRSLRSADDASARRAAQRALKAPAVALNAVNSAAIPLTFENVLQLIKITGQAEKQLAKLTGLPCEDSDRSYATHQLDHAILVLHWKLYCSLKLVPAVIEPFPFAGDGDALSCLSAVTRDLRDRRLELYKLLKAEAYRLVYDPMCERLMADGDLAKYYAPAQTEPKDGVPV